MKTVLMVAPYFIPRRRVGSLRPFKFAVHLQNMGWKVTVLTIGTSSGTLTQREKEALEGVEIKTVYPPFDRTTNASKPGDEKVHSNTNTFFDRIGDWVDKQTPADTWIYLFLIRYWKILKEVKAVNPDVIWSTGDPWSGLWLGNKLAQRLQVPFVADFRDPWTLTNINLRNRSLFSHRLDQKMEKRIVENSDKVIFTSKAAETAYKSHYSLPDKKTSTIYNSFDSTLINEQESSGWNVLLDDSKLHILFFGQFRRLSPPKPIIDVLKVLETKSKKVLKSIRIHSFGEMDAENKKLINDLGFNSQFIEHEKVLPEKTKSVLNSADILLVSTQEDRSQIVPAKLWDYLSADRPILSIAPNPEIGDILKKSGAGIHFHPEEKKEIADFLIQALQNKADGQPIFLSLDDTESSREFYNSAFTAKELSELLDRLVKDG